MTLLQERPVSYATRLEETSRIPLVSGGTLAANATLSAFGVRYVSTFGGLEAPPRAAAWLTEAADDLNRWLNEDEGWDGYGARRISLAVGRHVFKLLAGLAAANVPPPFITGTTTGGLHLQWENGCYDLQFSFEDEGAGTAYYWNKDTGEQWEGPVEKAASYFGLLSYRGVDD